MNWISEVWRVLTHPKQNFTLQLSGIVLAMSLLPLLTYGVASYRATQQAILDTATRHSLETLDNQREYLNLQMEQIEALAANLGQVEEISGALATVDRNAKLSSYDLLATNARIGYLLSNYRNLKGLVSIDLFSLGGMQYHVGDSLTYADQRLELRDLLMARTFKAGKSVLWHGVEDNVQKYSNSAKVVVASKLLMRPDSSWLRAEPVGMLVINYSTDELHAHFSAIDQGQGSYLLVTDDQQRLIYHPDKRKIGTPVAADFAQLLKGQTGSFLQRLGDTEVLLSYSQMPDKNWYVISIIPKATLLAPMAKIERMGNIMLLLSLVLIAVFVRLFTVRIVNPIGAISAGFEQFQQGRLASHWRMERPKSLAQIGELVSWFNAFLDSMDKRQEADTRLRIAATAFESQEGMFVTDHHCVILQVNSAFTAITGYSAAEAVGQNPRILNSGRHDAAFYRSMYALLNSTGAWTGEIWNRSKSGEAYAEWLTITAVKDSDSETTHYVATLTDITQRKAAEKEIEKLAFYDALTGLPNRRLLMDRLKQSLLASGRSRRNGALMLLDLDKFKTVNDTLGHDTGDLLLQQVGQRLVACVREGDTVARLGGDEFVVLLENLSTEPGGAAAQMEGIGRKVLTQLNKPYDLAGIQCHSTPSIGVTLFNDQHCPLEELFKQADIALYQAKESGRNTLRFFDAPMQAKIMARAKWESDLRQGLAQAQFLLHFQPQVDHHRLLTGAEVLVRWHHLQQGMVLPADFIPLAEETGLIVPLGLWVLEAACRQLVRWADHPVMHSLCLAVNVSARQFHQADFASQVLHVLQRTGANPSQLKLELTESLLVDDLKGVVEKMTMLKQQGVRFSLDDFGTGYSSLAYLKRLPLDQLKIDPSFVRDVLQDPNDATIARTIIALGQSMGLEVIAEGVETEEQYEFLRAHGCNAFQGYFFNRPLPLDEFERVWG